MRNNPNIQYLINLLAAEGKKLVESAYKNKDFTDRTYNLHDSYGCGVFYNRILQESTIYTLQAKATGKKQWYNDFLSGEEEIRSFLKDYERQTTDGLQLVIVAAMPYAEVLESGKNLTRKYKVISSIYGDMKKTASKYGGIVERI